jgi:hypothetical protein
MKARNLVVCLLAFAACARYEWRNELDVPGLCDPAARPPSAIVAHQDPETATGGAAVDGRVTGLDGRSLAQARVLLSRPDTRVAASTDSTGSFRFDSMSKGQYALRVLRIGYYSAEDTLTMDSTAKFLEIRLPPMVNDGPCSGFSRVRVHQPWWKSW